MKPHELITLNISTQEVETVQKPHAYNIRAEVYKNHIAFAINVLHPTLRFLSLKSYSPHLLPLTCDL